MSISAWKGSKKINVVKHRPSPQSEQRPFEQRMQDNEKVEGRLRSLTKLIRPLAVVTAMSVLASGCASTSFNPEASVDQSGFSPVKTQAVDKELQKDAKGLQEMISNAQLTHQFIAGSDTLAIVDRDDQNLQEIINYAQEHLIPGVENSVEQSKKDEFRFQFAQSVWAIDDKPSAIQGFSINSPERLCVVELDGGSGFMLDGLPIYLNDGESKLFKGSHELAHCQDGRNFHGEYIHVAIHKAEILADMTSALMIGSQTGNWDLVKNTIMPLRQLLVDDAVHATVPWVSQMMEQVDLNNIGPLSQRQAFDMASELYQGMDHDQLGHEKKMQSRLATDYRRYVSGNLEWDSLHESRQRFYQDHLGADDAKGFEKTMQEAGKARIELYLNHVNYKGKEASPEVSAPVVFMLEEYGKTFNDQSVIDLSDQLQNTWRLREQEAPLDLDKIANVLDINIDNEAAGRFEKNNEKLEEITSAYYGNKNIPEAFQPEFGRSLAEEIDYRNDRDISLAIEKLRSKKGMDNTQTLDI